MHVSKHYHVVIINTLTRRRRKTKTPKPTVIFENEEASKLLDYFVAYKKLIGKADYLKCMAALNSEISFCTNNPQLSKETSLDSINQNQATTNLLPTQQGILHNITKR